MPVPLLAGGGVAAVAIVWVGRVAEVDATALDLARHQQFATVVAAAVGGMSIGDAASCSLESTPRYRWVGVHLRHLIVAITFIASWAATLAALPGPLTDLHARPLAIEAVGWFALALMVGALAGPVAVPVSTVGVLLILPFLPATLALHVNAATSAWSPAQSRWLAVAIVSASFLAASRRDPATSKPFRAVNGARGEVSRTATISDPADERSRGMYQ